MGIFDVSHMLGVMIRGADRVEFMEKMCVADLQVGRPNPGGGTGLAPAGGAGCAGPRPSDRAALSLAP